MKKGYEQRNNDFKPRIIESFVIQVNIGFLMYDYGENAKVDSQ